ncbi:gamma-glutamylcyclotransferase family protein [Sphingobium phenoxybenzoativorans]|uniref:gamma-glutamylcyclotransferase family protein n=1 Tax=Sphingobium phenoxybenzoativorans TaxID=1592790 RepID=UPI0008730132|nr:gamma-glutamylcyclotransferase family protein [Sphingobium phenoxybenzoativorans]
MAIRPTRLFVYGTLRKGGSAPLADRLAQEARWLGRAEARGALYRIDGYPGFVPDANGGPVTGDLFEIDPGGALLAALDDYEECAPPWPEPHEYRRTVIEVETEHGRTAAWTYLYAWPVEGRERIAGGDFLG